VIGQREDIRQIRLDLGAIRSEEVEGDILERLGLQLYRPPLPPVLGKVIESGAAQRAGLRSGDRIETAGGRAVETWEDLVRTVRARPGATREEKRQKLRQAAHARTTKSKFQAMLGSASASCWAARRHACPSLRPTIMSSELPLAVQGSRTLRT
jgi:predicted metalloprotease with PDZ domain